MRSVVVQSQDGYRAVPQVQRIGSRPQHSDQVASLLDTRQRLTVFQGVGPKHLETLEALQSALHAQQL